MVWLGRIKWKSYRYDEVGRFFGSVLPATDYVRADKTQSLDVSGSFQETGIKPYSLKRCISPKPTDRCQRTEIWQLHPAPTITKITAPLSFCGCFFSTLH